jgi:Flp pilus assembly protein TadD
MARDSDKHDPLTKSDAHNARGIALADRGWLDESIREFRRAIELDPHSAHAHDNIATVYAEKGMLLDALLEYVKAIELEKESPTAHYNLACFLATHGQTLAVREYQEVARIEWDYPDVHLNLGLTLAERGQFAEALEEYQIALKLDPNDSVARHEMATVLMDLGRHADAIPHLRQVTREDGENLDAHVDLGIAYGAKGFYGEAERALKTALLLDPSDILGNYHLAAIHSVRGDMEGCVQYLAEAIKVDGMRVRHWVDGDRFFDAHRGKEPFIALFEEIPENN